MKNLYVIASAAAEDMESEKLLWGTLSENGWAVRGIYDLPRLESNDIIIARPDLARLIKKRVSTPTKKVFLITLWTEPDILYGRATKKISQIEKNLLACKDLCSREADVWFPGDDLEGASILIQRYIEKQEMSV